MASPRMPARRANGSKYVVAMVLGTALSTLPAAVAQAAPSTEAPAPGLVTDLERYCAACWRNARLDPEFWADSTQEVFRRLLERVPTSQWRLALRAEGEERRELFRAIDAVKKRVQRSRRFVPTPVECIVDVRDAGESTRTDERAAVELASAELLSERQREIIRMCFDGWEIADIAEELSLPVERVSDEKYKAVKKLRAHLAEGSSHG